MTLKGLVLALSGQETRINKSIHDLQMLLYLTTIPPSSMLARTNIYGPPKLSHTPQSRTLYRTTPLRSPTSFSQQPHNNGPLRREPSNSEPPKLKALLHIYITLIQFPSPQVNPRNNSKLPHPIRPLLPITNNLLPLNPPIRPPTPSKRPHTIPLPPLQASEPPEPRPRRRCSESRYSGARSRYPGSRYREISRCETGFGIGD